MGKNWIYLIETETYLNMDYVVCASKLSGKYFIDLGAAWSKYSLEISNADDIDTVDKWLAEAASRDV